MPNQHVMTTGQVSGLLGIPSPTIQRYIRSHPSHFSDQARRPDRGRRYTADDVNNLATIRGLHQTHAGHAAIENALSQATPGQAVDVPSVFAILDMAAGAMDQTAENVKTVKQLTARIEYQADWINRMRKLYMTQKQEINLMRLEIYKLKLITRKYRLNERPKNTPFWARSFWQKFLDFCRIEYDKEHSQFESDMERIERERQEYLQEFPEHFRSIP